MVTYGVIIIINGCTRLLPVILIAAKSIGMVHMIDKLIWIGITYTLLLLMHFMTSGESDWLAYLYITLLLIAVVMYLITKFIEWGADRLHKSDKKHWGS